MDDVVRGQGVTDEATFVHSGISDKRHRVLWREITVAQVCPASGERPTERRPPSS